MSELRWNPLLRTWTMVAANRQNRPLMPKDWCPFCPGPGKKVPTDFEVLLYPNDFPALSGLNQPSLQMPPPWILYKTEEANGACEVILYSPDHDVQLHQLSEEHLRKLVDLWSDRMEYFRSQEIVKYVFEFENRGSEVGVTMPHPHGQLYAYPFVPLKLETELRNCRDYFNESGRNLLADMLHTELAEGQRLIFETDHFAVFLPHFTDYPYGIFIVPKVDIIWIDELNTAQRSEFGLVLRDISGMFDALFDRPFPYMMCFHQGAVNSPEWEDQRVYYRFHVEFYPPLRASNAIKYYASSEMGAWAAANTRAVEETAIELRTAHHKFQQSLL
jgi:UDPglucose--hexose-1-phosphate uridylyltransferase